MNNENKLVDVTTDVPFVYAKIPSDYLCVYKSLIAMMADYGEEMLKDCKASCKEKNEGIIECFNMFNAAVSAKEIGNIKLADTLILYIKEKINLIYKNYKTDKTFLYPLNENGKVNMFITCTQTGVEIKVDEAEIAYYIVGKYEAMPDVRFDNMIKFINIVEQTFSKGELLCVYCKNEKIPSIEYTSIGSRSIYNLKTYKDYTEGENPDEYIKHTFAELYKQAEAEKCNLYFAYFAADMNKNQNPNIILL